MFDQTLLLFLLITLSGFLVVFIGARNHGAYRRHIIVTGVAILHLGIFGILYLKVPFTPFLALVLLVLSTFTLIDPIKMGRFLPARFCLRLGFLLLLAALAFFLLYLIAFPIWLWAFPLALFVMPYTLPTWKSRQVYFRLAGFLLLALFIGVGVYTVYVSYRPDGKVEAIDSWIAPVTNTQTARNHLPFLKSSDPTPPTTGPNLSEHPFQDLEIIQNPLSQPPQTPTAPQFPTKPPVESAQTQPEAESQSLQNGPLLDSLREFDQKYLELKHDYQKLQDKYREALQDLEKLKQENETLKKNSTLGSSPLN